MIFLAYFNNKFMAKEMQSNSPGHHSTASGIDFLSSLSLSPILLQISVILYILCFWWQLNVHSEDKSPFDFVVLILPKSLSMLSPG